MKIGLCVIKRLLFIIINLLFFVKILSAALLQTIFATYWSDSKSIKDQQNIVIEEAYNAFDMKRRRAKCIRNS